MMEIREVNFAVSNICNANCIFCPRSYVPVESSKRYMSVDLVEKVLSQVVQSEFKKKHPVVHCVPSENGEPFLNPNILDILRTIRKYGMAITLFSNFALLTEEITQTLISERLLDSINVNIDGVSCESFRASKQLNLNIVEANLRKFIEIRNEMKSSVSIHIHILTQRTYTSAVLKEYSRIPNKLGKEIYDEDRDETLHKWKSIINPIGDSAGIDPILFWAERYEKEPRMGKFKCINIERVKHVAYINPEGNWYACCFDMGNELIVGNVNKQSMMEIAESSRRKELVSDLEKGNFKKIGFPCSRVDTCQVVSPE